jgi:hypothetical protein
LCLIFEMHPPKIGDIWDGTLCMYVV